MHVVITGASTGIGAGLARGWAREGVELTLVSRSRPDLGIDARFVHADLARPDPDLSWVRERPIDVLVNNAGVQLVGPTEGLDPARVDAMMWLDLLAPLAILQAAAPAMLARGAGTIVNVSSMAALAPTPGMTHYNAAKAGLAAASESLRGEWRGTGVNVVTVYPGPVRTRLAETALVAYGPMTRSLPVGTVEGLAERVLAAVAARRGRVVYPWYYGAARYWPGTTRWILDRVTPRPRLADSDATTG